MADFTLDDEPEMEEYQQRLAAIQLATATAKEKTDFNVVLGKRMSTSRDLDEFCQCNCCAAGGEIGVWHWQFATNRECYCCTETLASNTIYAKGMARFVQLSELADIKPTCVTKHAKFEKLVLDKEILQQYGFMQGIVPERTLSDTGEELTEDQWKSVMNRYWRHLAYKSFVTMTQEKAVGYGKRLQLPSCVVNVIKTKFPNYTKRSARGYMDYSLLSDWCESDFEDENDDNDEFHDCTENSLVCTD